MTNLQRITGKTFGETASATGEDPEIGQFGSAKAGTYIGTTDVATIQDLPAWSNGFIDSVTPDTQFPPLPEVTGAMKVLSYQENYLLQKGIAEWDSGTTYYAGDFCKGIGEGRLYYSKIDNNTNNALTDTNSWEEFAPVASTTYDGQWVSVGATLFSSVNEGSYLIDFSSRLPVDSFSYEVLLVAQGRFSSGYRTVYMGQPAPSNMILYGRRQDSDVQMPMVNSFTRIIGPSRKTQLYIVDGNLAYFNLYITGYRRIGTNV